MYSFALLEFKEYDAKNYPKILKENCDIASHYP